MRAAFVLAIAIVSTGCVNSAFYQPGPHSYAVLDQPRDLYVSTGKGSAMATVAGEAGVSQEVEIAHALGPVVLLARASEVRTNPGNGFVFDKNWIRQTQVEMAVGRLARPWEGASVQDLFGVSRASSDVAQSSNPDDDPPYRAHGKYWRVYLQRAAVLRKTFGDAGVALRLSAVHADRFQRLGSTFSGPGSYSIVMPDTGSRTGVFIEPGLMFRVGYKGVKVGPSLSFPYRINRTSYNVNPVNLSVNLSVSIEPKRPSP